MIFLMVSDYSRYFEFRLCADKTDAEQMVTRECFDRHLLQLADESGATHYYVQPTGIMNNTFHNVSVVLPYQGANCKYCVIQWRYRTGQLNHHHNLIWLVVIESDYYIYYYYFLGHQSWGTCNDGSFAMGCGADEFQQEIRNCADVTIELPVTRGFLFDPPSRSAIDANADDEEDAATAHIDHQLADDVLLLDCGGQEVQ